MSGGFRESTVSAADGTPIGFHSAGEGPGLVVVSAVLSTGLDYGGLASDLAGAYAVHLLDRRGRGLSGPQRSGHSIDDECDDLLTVAAATGATTVFGHSFGGLVALEAARRAPAFHQVVVYEPGVPIAGTMRLGWLGPYEERLAKGDRRGAFACMVKGAGFAPRALSAMPLWYVRAVLRLAVRGDHWRAMEPLLEANVTEHRIAAALASPTAERYRSVNAAVLLLGGGRSPHFIRDLLTQLNSTLTGSEMALLPGLDHLAPEHQPAAVAAAILSRLKPPGDLPRP